MLKDILITPDPLKTPGYRYAKTVIFKGSIQGEKIWVKKLVNNKLKYVFDCVYFEPLAIIEGCEKRRWRYYFKK